MPNAMDVIDKRNEVKRLWMRSEEWTKDDIKIAKQFLFEYQSILEKRLEEVDIKL